MAAIDRQTTYYMQWTISHLIGQKITSQNLSQLSRVHFITYISLGLQSYVVKSQNVGNVCWGGGEKLQSNVDTV
jgi:hypothetical protein